jgi:hypothetical protein
VLKLTRLEDEMWKKGFGKRGRRGVRCGRYRIIRH